MTIKEQLNKVRDQLQVVAEVDRGEALIAFDHVHLWNLLLFKPGTPRIVIVYEGDEPRVNFDGGSRTGRVDRQFSVVISRGRGLNLERGASLTDGAGGGRPMFEMVDDLITAIRTLSNVAEIDEGPIDYKGAHKVDPPSGMIVDAYQVDFSAGTDIGVTAVVADDPQQ